MDLDPKSSICKAWVISHIFLTLVAIEKYVWDSNYRELTSGSHFVVAGT
jgi:hypothetical protein